MNMTGKIFLFLADGFEEIEVSATVDILRRAELDVQIVSIMQSLEATGAHGLKIMADSTFDTTSFEEIQMCILPGGMPGASNLYAHEGLRNLLLQTAEKQLPLSAICAAPLVFGRLGLLEGKKATCYPGFEEELKGAEIVKKPVVTDGLFITANGPGSAMDFAFAIVSRLCGEEKVAELKTAMMVVK